MNLGQSPKLVEAGSLCLPCRVYRAERDSAVGRFDTDSRDPPPDFSGCHYGKHCLPSPSQFHLLQVQWLISVGVSSGYLFLIPRHITSQEEDMLTERAARARRGRTGTEQRRSFGTDCYLPGGWPVSQIGFRDNCFQKSRRSLSPTKGALLMQAHVTSNGL